MSSPQHLMGLWGTTWHYGNEKRENHQSGITIWLYIYIYTYYIYGYMVITQENEILPTIPPIFMGYNGIYTNKMWINGIKKNNHSMILWGYNGIAPTIWFGWVQKRGAAVLLPHFYGEDEDKPLDCGVTNTESQSSVEGIFCCLRKQTVSTSHWVARSQTWQTDSILLNQ